MTDHPRFHIADVSPDERYRQYHGAPQVELVLRIVDWWRITDGESRSATSRSSDRPTQKRRKAMHRGHVAVSPLASSFQIGVLVLLLSAVLGLLAHSMLVDGGSGQIAGQARLKPTVP